LLPSTPLPYGVEEIGTSTVPGRSLGYGASPAFPEYLRDRPDEPYLEPSAQGCRFTEPE
jgi:hypothetical protein